MEVCGVGGGGLVFWLQKQQPSVFELKCADAFPPLTLRVNTSFSHE